MAYILPFILQKNFSLCSLLLRSFKTYRYGKGLCICLSCTSLITQTKCLLITVRTPWLSAISEQAIIFLFLSTEVRFLNKRSLIFISIPQKMLNYARFYKLISFTTNKKPDCLINPPISFGNPAIPCLLYWLVGTL